jgi:hypothetical protein
MLSCVADRFCPAMSGEIMLDPPGIMLTVEEFYVD